MAKKLKHVELTVNDAINLKKISFVHDPAMEGQDFMYFSNEEVFTKSDAEKGLVTGLIMRPNKIIPRINKKSGEEYTISFTSDTVRAASEYYMMDNHNGDVNLEHKYPIEGVFLVESYIIKDKKVNNATAMGFTDVEEGDWWGTMNVNGSPDLKQFIKNGTVKGFSIEGQFINAMLTQMEKMESENDEAEKENIEKTFLLIEQHRNDFSKLTHVIEE